MKRKNNFGYKVLLGLVLGGALLHVAAAREHESPFDYPDPDPAPVDTPVTDSPAVATPPRPGIKGADLQFPLQDNSGNVTAEPGYEPMQLQDPGNIDRSVEYDPESNRFYLTEKIGNEYYRNPTYLTFEEYQKYQAQKDEQDYWRRRLDALTLFNKKPVLPPMSRNGIFDRIFGNQGIQVRPQGNVDVTLGFNSQNIKNPTLVQRAQKYTIFDFDMQMNINLLATIGDKMKLNISNNTKATFDYQNVQRLEYIGKEDEIIKKIEAGNISFPLRSTLTPGPTSLFGLKTQLQFGRLWVTAAVSQQKSKRQSLTIQGGSQTQQFAIKADDYDENKHFLLGHYFRNNYNTALQNFPVIQSLVQINKIELWVTNRTGATDGVRDMVCFMDLGERDPFREEFRNPTVANAYPDNRSNTIYDQLQQSPVARQQGQATAAVISIGLRQGQDFERTTARKLQPSEFSFNPQLGYVSLNTQLNPDDVLAVAYRYTYNGKVYQVGEFAEDLPPDTTNQKVMYLKLLKGTSARPSLPIWDLMMKNVYSLGGAGVSKEDFRLNVLYQDPGGGEKRYLPESDIPNPGTPLLTLLNLDRLNFQNDPQPDGIFDFVEGITINTQQGKIIFPVLEPFGNDLKPALGGNVQFERKYLYQVLYDSTKTVARQFQQNNRFVTRGSYKSASSSEIFLGGFNIPQGSVTVTAGGTLLVENQDYQIDYGLGRLKILNTGVLASNMPINVSYEDNATFGFQQQNFMGTRFDYYVNDNLALGATWMRLSERPFTQKTSFGEDPIKNTVLGGDANYQSEFPALTRILDKLPIYSTVAPSFINASAEVAAILPGHPAQINALDPEGSVYIDDFEGTRSTYDLKFPFNSWTLASTPTGARDAAGNLLFPEATDNNSLTNGRNRARLAWYMIEPSLVDPSGGIPDYVKQDTFNQHYIRMVQAQDVFPQRSNATLQNALSTLDLTFWPKERGPYNFDVSGLTPDGQLQNARGRWGGIMRPIEYSDFEASNVEYIEFWMLDPFIDRADTMSGGSLTIDLGNVSEDVLKDSRKFFENGITNPKNTTTLDRSVWGFIPRFQQQITRSFDNDPVTRALQDVGYDGADDSEEKADFFSNYLQQIASSFGTTAAAYTTADADPAADNYKHFRDADYDANGTKILRRYKYFNNPQGNSPIASDNNGQFSNASTNIPESEDINRDNTLNESEDFFQYRLDIQRNMAVGTNYIVSKQESNVKLPNGEQETETWYQFKIPIREYTSKVGSIGDFRSIRFMRMYTTGFTDSVTMRFAQINLGRNQWRRYMYSLMTPGLVIPGGTTTDFAVTSVSVEENSQRDPVPYVIPPGVNRQQSAQANGQNIQLNEQALSLQICGLEDGDARAAFKETTVDMRQFENLRMFIHGESRVGQAPLQDGDVWAFIRIGSDFTNNYYEYQVPLKVTPPGVSNSSPDLIWPLENQVDLPLKSLVTVKTNRNDAGLPALVPYSEVDSRGNTIVVVGNPNIGDAKTIMLGVLNPKRTNSRPQDDGQSKCTEVWFNEMRMTGLNEDPAYAATGKVSVQLADLGSINASGSMHTQGYGNIDQKLNQRQRDDYYQYDANTNLSVGKLMPRKWGVQLPLFVGYSESVSNPQYNPYDLDVDLSEQLDRVQDGNVRDSIKKAAQDFTSMTSFNLTNVRITGDPEKQKPAKPWSIRNFDFTIAHNRQFKRNPLIEYDELINDRYGLGYTYAVKAKSFEPFKKLIKSKSKWWGLIKDFNLNPLPSNFTFRTEMNRTFNETQVRNISGDGDYVIRPTYYKNFIWQRTYSTRWELTRSLSFDYNATNWSRIDEPDGRINTPEKRDTLWDRILSGGRNTQFTQSFNASYNVPLAKLPLTDWMNVRATYGATYNWNAASRLATFLGNTLGNTQSINLNGDLNFTQLYNKQRWLKAVNQPKRRTANSPVNNKGNEQNSKGGKNVDPRDGGRGDRNDRDAGTNVTDNGREPDVITQDPKAPEVPPVIVKDPWTLNGKKINIAGMSDAQLDSVRSLIRAAEKAEAKAAKAKRKAERKAARKRRRATPPNISGGERIAGKLLTMVKRSTINYTENSGSILPGFLDSTKLLGVNTSSREPGFGYVFGYQPDRDWLEQKAREGKLSTDPLFNLQFQQTYSQNLNITALVEPFQDFRVDLSLTKSFTKAHNELFKDTSAALTNGFTHNSPFQSGTFNISYIGIKTLFKEGGSNSETYQAFLSNRQLISERLGSNNPYSGGVPDPNDPNYAKGYTQYSQDVLLPAFIAAYTGKKAEDAPLVDYTGTSVRSNPFKYFMPLPNWRFTYTGLSKLPFLQDKVTNLVVNHSYTGSMSMNSFSSALFYQDLFNVGYPSFIDSNSGNFVPYFQVPNVTITETFGPLLGFDAAFKSGLTAKVEMRRNRTLSLSMIDYQVSEMRSSEIVVGMGARVRGLVLPFRIFGVKKLKNDLNIRVDVGIRDDRSFNSYLAQNIDIVTRGQKVITISPSADYIVSDRLTLRFFYDRRQTIPYTTQSFPTTTSRGGLTLRFIFAQ